MDTAPSPCAPNQGRGLGPSPLASASPLICLPNPLTMLTILPHSHPHPPTFHPSLGLVPLGQSAPDPASSLPHLRGVSPWPWPRPHPTRFRQPPFLSAPPSTSTPLAQCQSQIHPFRALSGPPPHYASPSQLLSPPSFFSPSPLSVPPTPAGAEMRATQGLPPC